MPHNKLPRSGLLEQTDALDAHSSRQCSAANGQLMDFLPFGGVEKDHHIAWPPNGEPEMNVMGLYDVLTASESVILPHGVKVRIATPASVAFLKLVACHDSPHRHQRDLEDIASLLRGYITEFLGVTRSRSVRSGKPPACRSGG